MKCWLDNEGIAHVVYPTGARIGLAQAHAEIDAVASLGQGSQLPAVVDMSGVRSVDRPARALYSGEKAKNTYLAVALVTNSPVSRVLGNFFLGLNKPSMPVRLFDREVDAVTWLRGLFDLTPPQP
jgi:hypothetical protein